FTESVSASNAYTDARVTEGITISNSYTDARIAESNRHFKTNSTMDAAAANGDHSVAVGGAATSNGHHGVAIGSGSLVNGDHSVAIGVGASAQDSNSVALGAGSTTSGRTFAAASAQPLAGNTKPEAVAVGEVSVGSAGAERQVTNVAAGTYDTDAVNVQQLKNVAANIGADINEINSRVDGQDVRIDALGNQVNQLNSRVEENRRVASAGIASALALQNQTVDQHPGEFAVGVGIGTYDG